MTVKTIRNFVYKSLTSPRADNRVKYGGQHPGYLYKKAEHFPPGHRKRVLTFRAPVWVLRGSIVPPCFPIMVIIRNVSRWRGIIFQIAGMLI
jgi:hypothetical protein